MKGAFKAGIALPITTEAHKICDRSNACVDCYALAKGHVGRTMGNSGLTRRKLVAALSGVVVPSAQITCRSIVWTALTRDLQMAEQQLRAAMSGLAQAEGRYFALPRQQRRKSEPDWYVAAQHAEGSASAIVEAVYRRIAQTRADSPEALRMKLRLLAAAYGDDPDASANSDGDDDLVACLIHSLISDLSVS